MRAQLEIDRQRMRLAGSEVTDAYYQRVDVRGGVAEYSRWLGCTFIDCRLSTSAFTGATFDRCRFVRCDFSKAILVSSIYRTEFDSCNLDDCTLRGADIQGTTFTRSRAQRSDWTRANLKDCKLDLDLRGAVLNFSSTDNVDFTGANFWSALLPFNCAGFVGNTFDERQIELFHCLLGASTTEQAKALGAAVKPWYRAVFKRLMRLQG